MLRDFKLDDSSYPEAWAYVLARFDNKRLVVKTLFHDLCSIEAAKNETQVRQLLRQRRNNNSWT